jgi:hypothetical protein
VAVVLPPAANVFVQFIDDLVNAPTATAAGQFPNSILETFNRFGMDANTGIRSGTGKAKPEVLAPPGVADGALGFINLEFEFPGNEATDTDFHSACGSMAANIDDTIVSVSDKPKPSTFQLFVKFIKDHIGQQRRKWPPLWDTLFGGTDQSSDQDSTIEIAANQREDAFIRYPGGKATHKAVVIHAVEEFLQIKINDVSVTLFNNAKTRLSAIRVARRLIRRS